MSYPLTLNTYGWSVPSFAVNRQSPSVSHRCTRPSSSARMPVPPYPTGKPVTVTAVSGANPESVTRRCPAVAGYTPSAPYAVRPGVATLPPLISTELPAMSFIAPAPPMAFTVPPRIATLPAPSPVGYAVNVAAHPVCRLPLFDRHATVNSPSVPSYTVPMLGAAHPTRTLFRLEISVWSYDVLYDV